MMMMMRSYKLTSILAAQKYKLRLTQTHHGGPGVEWSGERHVEEYKHSRVQKTGDIFTTEI